MTWEAYLTIAVVMAVFVGLVRDIATPAQLMLAGLAVLMTAGAAGHTPLLPTPAQAVAGFGNAGLVTIGLLFVVVSGLIDTGAVGMIAGVVLGRSCRLAVTVARMALPVAAMSAFLNNTPIVAMFLPAVDEFSKKSRIPTSKLLLPLSYASIFGGMCTLIGTSTNLIVDGMLRQSGHTGMGLFSIAWVGLPIATAGILYLTVFARRLPDNRPGVSLDDDPRSYTAEVIVEPGGALVGKSVEQAGLRHLPGLFLADIERDGKLLPAVAPTERLRDADRLVFVGIAESVVDLHRIRGILPATDQVFKLRGRRDQRVMVEVVVSDACPIVGKSIREGGFRNRYDAVVVAVGRGGKKLGGKIGDVRLAPGDTLILEARPDFARRQKNARDFFLVSKMENSAPRRFDKAGAAMAILGAMVATTALGWLSMLNASLLAAAAMVLTGCSTAEEAKNRIDWSVLIVIGAALGIGKALSMSGASAHVASLITALSGGHPWFALAAVFALTSVMTELVTNNAAAVLMFPIAESVSAALHVHFMPFVVAVMVAASASFSTPMGYQTNLMVYGPGGYRASDYLRFGLPLNLLSLCVTVAIAPMIWHF